jgi:DNA-binding PadR family transcriptional regulator
MFNSPFGRDEFFHRARHAMARGHGHKGGHGWRGQRGVGFGDGGGFGPGRGGRIFGAGDLRLALLDLIAQQPRNGYDLIKDIEQTFGGAYAPSPGSVYPTLTLLEEIGHITASEGEGGKKVFTVTEDGRAFLADNKDAVDAVRTRMEMAARALSGDRPPEEIFHAMHILKTALRFHRGGWSDAETGRIAKIIRQAARDIEDGGEKK